MCLEVAQAQAFSGASEKSLSLGPRVSIGLGCLCTVFDALRCIKREVIVVYTIISHDCQSICASASKTVVATGHVTIS
jgi:hypothetical protein